MKFPAKDRKTVGGTGRLRLGALSAALLIVACIPQSNAREATPPPVQTAQVQKAPIWTPAPPPQPVAPSPASAAQRMLDARIDALGRAFNGDIGIAVKDIQTGWTTHYDGTTWFPQQSVSKFWVALTALDRADRGHLDLDAPVTVRRDDLTLFHQPIADLVGSNGYNTTIRALMNRAITQSDNTANDFVLWKAGGPDAVRSFLLDKRIQGIRFGPGERDMQSRIAGMEWRQSYSIGRNFYTARANVPTEVRRTAFESYIKDPIDGATPIGIVDALARLHQGDLLSPESTRLLLDTMSNTRTGPRRLKGGLAQGWKLAHKTGTGQVFGGAQAGYNDIGIVTAPDGRAYAVAVMIRRTSAPNTERMAVMQDTVRAVIDYAGNMRETYASADQTHE